VYPTDATGPKEACATFDYSSGGSIPVECDVAFVVDGKGRKKCHTCRVCARIAFTVNCNNVLPYVQPTKCEMLEDPQKDSFAHLVEIDQRSQPFDIPVDSDTEKTSKSIGPQHFPLLIVWLANFLPFLLQ